MSISHLRKEQMSQNCYWAVETQFKAINVRSFPGYRSQVVGTVFPENIIYGRLYRRTWNRDQVEDAIEDGSYRQPYFFVILKDRSGSVAVTAETGEYILQYISDVQGYRSQKALEASQRQWDARRAARKAEDEARHQRHMGYLDSIANHFNKPRASSGTDNSYEIEQLRKELRYWDNIASSGNPYVFQDGAPDKVSEIKSKIWRLENQ